MDINEVARDPDNNLLQQLINLILGRIAAMQNRAAPDLGAFFNNLEAVRFC